MAMNNLHIRPATSDDIEFVVALLPRRVEFGPPDRRDPGLMMATDREVLTDAIGKPLPATEVLIVQGGSGERLGFIHLTTLTDYYTRQPHGHIADLVVAPEGEGKGIARVLMKAGEAWATRQGFEWITLSVFAQNTHAREVYEGLGYGQDVMRYVKVLN